jgi:polycystin 2
MHFLRLLFEYPATGGCIPSFTFRTLKLIRYVTGFDHFVMACEGLFFLFLIYYTIEEIIEIKKHKLQYFKSFWNILDVVVLLLGYIAVLFHLYRTVVVGNLLEGLLDNPKQYANFDNIGFWQTQFNNNVAIAVFFSWIKANIRLFLILFVTYLSIFQKSILSIIFSPSCVVYQIFVLLTTGFQIHQF